MGVTSAPWRGHMAYPRLFMDGCHLSGHREERWPRIRSLRPEVQVLPP